MASRVLSSNFRLGSTDKLWSIHFYKIKKGLKAKLFLISFLYYFFLYRSFSTVYFYIYKYNVYWQFDVFLFRILRGFYIFKERQSQVFSRFILKRAFFYRRSKPTSGFIKARAASRYGGYSYEVLTVLKLLYKLRAKKKFWWFTKKRKLTLHYFLFFLWALRRGNSIPHFGYGARSNELRRFTTMTSLLAKKSIFFLHLYFRYFHLDRIILTGRRSHHRYLAKSVLFNKGANPCFFYLHRPNFFNLMVQKLRLPFTQKKKKLKAFLRFLYDYKIDHAPFRNEKTNSWGWRLNMLVFWLNKKIIIIIIEELDIPLDEKNEIIVLIILKVQQTC
jgi:hypothetical protein